MKKENKPNTKQQIKAQRQNIIKTFILTSWWAVTVIMFAMFTKGFKLLPSSTIQALLGLWLTYDSLYQTYLSHIANKLSYWRIFLFCLSLALSFAGAYPVLIK